MTTPSPILAHLRQREPDTLRWGMGDDAPEVIGGFGELEIEYATLRRSCVLLDEPQRATIEVVGADALPFLDRMLTQKLADLEPGRARASFWLNRQGRIVADLVVVSAGEQVLIDVDISRAAEVVSSLDTFIIGEDVTLRVATGQRHRFALVGPSAAAVLAAASGREVALEPGDAWAGEVAGSPVVVYRADPAGEPGLECIVPAADAVAVLEGICAVAEGAGVRTRPVGWHAFNIARVENGTPLFNLDFGPDSLPAETGLLDSRVSFTKGCYLGQEIVARMRSRGHPKQRLVGLRLADPAAAGQWQPVTGTPLHAAEGAVGAVTSSTISPMLGGEPVCLAMVLWKHSDAGTRLELRDGDQSHACVVQERLRFWPRG
jgi:folate-binding protein YgfZ